MSDSKQQGAVELPPLDVEWYNETRDLRKDGRDDHERTRAVLHCRERQLRDALTALAKLRTDYAAAIQQLAAVSRAAGQAEGKLRASELAGVVDGWKDRAERAEAALAEMTKERDVSTPHRNKEQGTSRLSDERLAQMCNETKWWKTDDDEIYRVVHELRDNRAALAAKDAELAAANLDCDVWRRAGIKQQERAERAEAERDALRPAQASPPAQVDRDAVLEEAARQCEMQVGYAGIPCGLRDTGKLEGYKNSAAVIRALKSAQSQPPAQPQEQNS